MSTYKYRTESGKEFEVEQSMMDDHLTEHPETGEPCKRVPYTKDEAQNGFTIKGYQAGNGYS